jgi:hypothetical protein
MTVKSDLLDRGADIHLNALECELLMQLACNAEKANGSGTEQRTVYSDGAPTYMSVSLALGRRLLALAHEGR